MNKKPNILAIVFVSLLLLALCINYWLFGLIAALLAVAIVFLSGVVAIVFTPFPVIVRIKSRINLRLNG